MTKPQRITLMADWWPAACTAQGWNPNDRARRLEVLSQAVGRPLNSANDLDRLTDIDAVKSHLLALSQPANLDAQVAQANMPKTRLLHAIRAFNFHPNYVAAILAQRFHQTDLENLDLKQLTQLRNTLAARKNSQRVRTLSTASQTDPNPF